MNTPPSIAEHHVRVPDQLATLLNATQAHTRGVHGEGVRVAVIDSGFFMHPFYVERGYKITHLATQKEKEPHIDEYGHGTAQLASLFAIAPRCEALVIKCMDRDPSLALERALEAKPDVLSCAWGFNIDHPGVKKLPREYKKMHSLLRKAVEDGITVVAAAGNGQRSFPGCMPEVISAGGVFYAPDGRFYPSDVSSKFESSLFAGRSVPDVCGLVGNRPYGRLLLVPVPPKAKLARRPAFSTIAAGDSSAVPTKKGGAGWAMFSGTSAATSMLSGAAALLLQVSPKLSPKEIQTLLIQNARNMPGTGCKVLNVEAALNALTSK